ncbi:hypothetical protein OQA88_268 [Cercophora sp. LCS_1]
MADKEATVYIVDVGEAMVDCHNGRDESDLDWGMRYVWDKISTTVAANRKTWTVGVVGLGTNRTSNPQASEGLEGYDHISVLQEIQAMSMTNLRELRSRIKPSRTSAGDAFSAIIVAMSMIETYTKKLKYNRKIILVTNAEVPIEDPEDSIDEVAGRLNELGIELVVIGVDFDDADYGFKEEDKTSTKRGNEAALQNLVDKCKMGVYGTMAQAVEELSTPRIKSVRPFKTYDGPLTLGDPSKYESALSIHVERYFKTKRATVPSASTVVLRPDVVGMSQAFEGEDVEMGGTDFSGVKQMRTYRVNDPDAPGGKRDVPFEDLDKGYQYGRTVVPFSQADYPVIKLETTKEFTILGFIPFSSVGFPRLCLKKYARVNLYTQYEPFFNMGEACVIAAQRQNEKAELALSALIHALHELESYAVARYIQKEGAQPQLLLLKPNPGIDDPFECLYDVPLPFAEDVRTYQFPPLDKVLTVTGQALTEHRLLPDDKLNQAMSDFVDAMDLSEFSTDDDGKPAEYAPIDDLYNPIIHRINQAIRARAVHPDEPVGEPAEILLRYSKPPEALVKDAYSAIEELIDAAEVKKVPAKAQGKRGKKDTVKPLSGLDIDALLGQSKRTTISKDNAIPEYRQALAAADDDATVESATKQMGEIVKKLIQDSFADLQYPQAAANMRVMREELISLEMPALYNKFLTSLKSSILSGELNGDRREMWFKHIIGGKISLITQTESEVSGVTDEVAKEFVR